MVSVLGPVSERIKQIGKRLMQAGAACTALLAAWEICLMALGSKPATLAQPLHYLALTLSLLVLGGLIRGLGRLMESFVREQE